MMSYLAALLYGLWFLFAVLVCSLPVKRNIATASFQQAESKECKDKPFHIFPKFLLQKKLYYKRLNLLFRLTDPLRMLLSRLPDQQNVTKAMEMVRDEITEMSVRKLFDEYIYDIAIGSSVKDSLYNLKRKVGLRKFDIFIDNLTQAHYEGFTAVALKALDKSVEAMELDLREIQKVQEQSRSKKKKLFLAVGTVWLFPPILSVINSGDKNIFLATIQGKILMLFYFIGTIYVFIKGEEYLSLNLDEL